MTTGPAAATPWLLAWFLLTEYGMKEWLEGNDRTLRSRPALAYAAFRLVHLGINLAGGALLAGPSAELVLVVAGAELLCLTEVPLGRLDQALRSRFHFKLRWLQLLPAAALALWTLQATGEMRLSQGVSEWIDRWRDALPALAETHRLSLLLLGYVLAASPANHVIRCLVDKAPDHTVLAAVLRGTAFDAGELAGQLPKPREAADAPGPGKVRAELAPAREEHGADDALLTSPEAAGATTDSMLHAGRVIGTLERWIIVTLTLAGQYALIGLVITAKSIARFKRLEHDPQFAEYYLMGTLYSTLIGLFIGQGMRHV